VKDGARYLVATLDELDAIPIAHGLVWRPIRRRFDLRGFGVNAYTAEEAGGQVVEEHTEERLQHEELYVVVRGRATFGLDGVEVDAPATTFVHVADPQVRRVATAATPDTVVLALGGRPGRPFEVSAWEAVFAAMPATRREDWDEAIRLHEEALAEHPGNVSLLYNLACAETLAGRHLDGLRHLLDAAERDPQAADWAQTDSDFAAIRSEPGFPPGRAVPATRTVEAAPSVPREPGAGWRVAALGELPEHDGWVPVRAELGFRPTGINVWIGHETGSEVIERHDEGSHEELYLVLAGRATFTLDGAELDLPAGSLLAVAPPVLRTAVAAEPGTAVLAIGAAPGEAFAPSAWEAEELARIARQADPAGQGA
jgi:quercetin dioxygenase-like cupin family protein